MSEKYPAACTIISRNYLSHARVLAQSFLQHHPGARFYLLVVDGLPGGLSLGGDIRIIDADELPLPSLSDFSFKYDVTELCTAVKPAMLSLLLDKYDEQRVIYLDPDILVTKEFTELIPFLDNAEIALIPHLLDPIPQDGLRPNEQDILVAGAYNLGFIAVRKTDTVRKFLAWWQERLQHFCFVDVARGLMTDQKWIDLVPGLFGAGIFKDDTYNVAYWNIHSRLLERRGDRYFINGRPLTFFHFSAFDPANPTVFSKHQDRTHVRAGEPLSDLLALYVQLHGRNEFGVSRTWRYGYGFFDNGVRVSLPLRRVYHALGEDERAEFGNPFQTDGGKSFFRWATDPYSLDDIYSPFLKNLYELRPDVASAYPDIRGTHRDDFIEWATTSGAEEFGFDPKAMRVIENGHPRQGADSVSETVVDVETFGHEGPRCSIIIPVHNKASLTLNCLDAVFATAPPDIEFEVIVSNDASTDDTLNLLDSYRDRIRVVSRSVNGGFAESCNEGAAIARGEYLIFLNNDTIAQPGWLEALLRYAGAEPQAAVVGAKLLFPNNTIQHCGIAICEDGQPRHMYAGIPANHPAANRSRKLQAVTGACMLVRSRDFRAAGGFDIAFRNGYEDVDLCLRLGELGREVHYCHTSVLFHLEAVSRETRGPHDIQNRKLFTARWRHRITPDELRFYVADELLRIEYPPLFPIQLSISPTLATVVGSGRDARADRLIEARSRQVLGLMKDNIRLSVRVQESELRVYGAAGRKVNTPGNLGRRPVEEPRIVHQGQLQAPARQAAEGHIVSIILPVKSGAAKLRKLLPAILGQRSEAYVEIIAVDSGSSDESVELLKQANATVVAIDPRSFNHGLTRNLATTYAQGRFFVFLNQSTLPADEHWLANLIRPLADDASLAAVCGRVLPRQDADLLTAREINANINASTERILTEVTDWNLYRSLRPHILRALVNFHTLSAAIRADVFRRMPFREADFAEDLLWGKAAIEAGLRIQFEPSSVAYHSHNYSLLDILRRNFDDGMACQKIVGVTMQEEEVAAHMRDIHNVWNYLEKDCGLTGEELELWRINAAVRRAAQVFGQWLGLNFHRVNGDLAALLSITEQIRAGAKTELPDNGTAHANSAR